LFEDRTPKFPLKQMALATRGPRNRVEQHMETAWREGLMNRTLSTHQEPASEHEVRSEH
jgi:hypothetical protein